MPAERVCGVKGNRTTDGIDLETILRRALDDVPPSHEEIRFLLELNDPGDIDRLFETARALRRRHFGDRVFPLRFPVFQYLLPQQLPFLPIP